MTPQALVTGHGRTSGGRLSRKLSTPTLTWNGRRARRVGIGFLKQYLTVTMLPDTLAVIE